MPLKTKGARGKHYVNLLGTGPLADDELRIVYVAVTRARKALAIAVPTQTFARWQEFLWPCR
ncbi:MAG: hypothetical protein GY794_08430 [bacterium]|nr:hypothetical protein [bacterium]